MYDEWSSVVIHIALDNTVIVNEISKSFIYFVTQYELKL